MIFVMLLLHCTIYSMGNSKNNQFKSNRMSVRVISLLIAYICIFRILQNRWQYFYKSQVLRGFSPGASDQPIPHEDQPEHAHQLLAILNTYGQALFHTIDPHITQTILTSLHCLHERWKLFDRQFFKTNLLASFLETLLNLLVSPNGILHPDQIISVLFHMSQVDGNTLESTFSAFQSISGANLITEIRLAKVCTLNNVNIIQVDS